MCLGCALHLADFPRTSIYYTIVYRVIDNYPAYLGSAEQFYPLDSPTGEPP